MQRFRACLIASAALVLSGCGTIADYREKGPSLTYARDGSVGEVVDCITDQLTHWRAFGMTFILPDATPYKGGFLFTYDPRQFWEVYPEGTRVRVNYYVQGALEVGPVRKSIKMCEAGSSPR